MKLYMVVTSDKYELPLAIGSAQEIADYLGVLRKTVYEQACGTHQARCNGKITKRKIIKIELEEDPCELSCKTASRNSAE